MLEFVLGVLVVVCGIAVGENPENMFHDYHMIIKGLGGFLVGWGLVDLIRE